MSLTSKKIFSLVILISTQYAHSSASSTSSEEHLPHEEPFNGATYQFCRHEGSTSIDTFGNIRDLVTVDFCKDRRKDANHLGTNLLYVTEQTGKSTTVDNSRIDAQKRPKVAIREYEGNAIQYQFQSGGKTYSTFYVEAGLLIPWKFLVEGLCLSQHHGIAIKLIAPEGALTPGNWDGCPITEWPRYYDPTIPHTIKYRFDYVDCLSIEFPFDVPCEYSEEPVVEHHYIDLTPEYHPQTNLLLHLKDPWGHIVKLTNAQKDLIPEKGSSEKNTRHAWYSVCTGEEYTQEHIEAITRREFQKNKEATRELMKKYIKRS